MIDYPKMAHIKLSFEGSELNDPIGSLSQMLTAQKNRIPEKGKIGIAVGSRGIDRIDQIVRTAVRFVKDCGADPVILPAMGSHGGATAEGQREVLASYGITEQTVGAPIKATMDIEIIGHTATGLPVHFDRIARGLGGIILVNRIKPHTDFHDTYESGLIKQMVIGLGNHKGAQFIHSFGLEGLKSFIPETARLILEKANIICGIAIVENAYDRIAEIHVLERSRIADTEPELLKHAKALMPALPFEKMDVLVIEYMGKNISGVGLDSNITGRFFIRQDPDADNNFIGRVVCLDITPESHGNALGMGMADIITKQLYDRIDFKKTYANVITSGFLERGFVPIVQDTEARVIETALLSCGRRIEPKGARIVQITDTLRLGEMFVSIPLLGEISPDASWEEIKRFIYTFSEKGVLSDRLSTRA